MQVAHHTPDGFVVLFDGLNLSRAYDTIGLLSRDLTSLHHLAKSALKLDDFKSVRSHLISIPLEGDVENLAYCSLRRFDDSTLDYR